jgi:hypothetical protein
VRLFSRVSNTYKIIDGILEPLYAMARILPPLSLLSVVTALYLLSMAAGHGFVENILIGGTSYPGWNPWNDPYV